MGNGGRLPYQLASTPTFTPCRNIPPPLCNWLPLGDGLTHTSGAAFINTNGCPMVVLSDGTGPDLYVVGTFTHAGGIPVANFAKWNGSSWSAEVPPVNGHDVGALDSFGGKFYFGGGFTTLGGHPA